MIIRELVASIGVDFNKKGADEAEQGISKIGSGLKSLIALAGGYAIGKGLLSMVNAASDVDESLNVLTQTFGDQTDAVKAWAAEQGEVMGRSEYSMRKYAGALGAVLAPTLGNKKAAAEMSESVAGLAVDLASFFNQEDDATLERLRSGLLGSTEAVDQLGINLRVESIEAFNAARGITKKWKAMTEAEKVESRYKKMLADTLDKQGDAARTAAGFANSSKRLKENLYDLAVVIGQQLLGPATSLVQWGTEMSTSFMDVVKNSELLKGAMIVLGGIAAGFAISWAIANIPLILTAATLAAMIAVIDDLLVSMNGGKGVIADFFKELVGEEGWAQVRKSWENQIKALKALKDGDFQGALNAWADADNVNPATRDSIAMQEANERLKEHDAGKGLRSNPWMPWLDNEQPEGTGYQAPLMEKGTANTRWWSGKGAGYTPNMFNPVTGQGNIGTGAPGGTHLTFNIGAGATPDTVREARRTADSMVKDRARNLGRTAAGAK